LRVWLVRCGLCADVDSLGVGMAGAGRDCVCVAGACRGLGVGEVAAGAGGVGLINKSQQLELRFDVGIN
jgi:hypothetical protein